MTPTDAELRNLHSAIEGESNIGSGDSTADVVLPDRSSSERPPNPIYDYREDPGWPAQ